MAHLIGMDTMTRTCALCENPIPKRRGRGRPRTYCSDWCRKLAADERINERSRVGDEIPPPMLVEGSLLDRWVQEGAKFDEIVQDPYLLGRFMDDLLCRIAVDHILENQRYQHAVNQLIVIYYMIGRMTDGDYKLPVIVG